MAKPSHKPAYPELKAFFEEWCDAPAVKRLRDAAAKGKFNIKTDSINKTDLINKFLRGTRPPNAIFIADICKCAQEGDTHRAEEMQTKLESLVDACKKKTKTVAATRTRKVVLQQLFNKTSALRVHQLNLWPFSGARTSSAATKEGRPSKSEIPADINLDDDTSFFADVWHRFTRSAQLKYETTNPGSMVTTKKIANVGQADVILGGLVDAHTMLLIRWFLTPFRVTLGALSIDKTKASPMKLRDLLSNRTLPPNQITMVLAGDPGEMFVETCVSEQQAILRMSPDEGAVDFAKRVAGSVRGNELRCVVGRYASFQTVAKYVNEMVMHEPIKSRGILFIANELACIGMQPVIEGALLEGQTRPKACVVHVFPITSAETALQERIELPEYVMGIGTRRTDKEFASYLNESLALYLGTERRTTAKAIRVLYWKLYVSVLDSLCAIGHDRQKSKRAASEFSLYSLGLQAMSNGNENLPWREIIKICKELLNADGVQITDSLVNAKASIATV